MLVKITDIIKLLETAKAKGEYINIAEFCHAVNFDLRQYHKTPKPITKNERIQIKNRELMIQNIKGYVKQNDILPRSKQSMLQKNEVIDVLGISKKTFNKYSDCRIIDEPRPHSKQYDIFKILKNLTDKTYSKYTYHYNPYRKVYIL